MREIVLKLIISILHYDVTRFFSLFPEEEDGEGEEEEDEEDA